ncbi:hypothetical protein [Ruminococcus sp.]|nr:hypothetical protein [Ruminococcus sp.]MCR5020090.1 hypothetical protein [Ruminococcus sp.]
MDITIDEMFRRLLTQMQNDTALSDDEKRRILEKLEKVLNKEESTDEKK